MIRSRLTTPGLAALATLALLPLGGLPAAASTGAKVDSDQSRETVAVTGRGEVSAKPDTLTADFAVETTAATVGKALDAANTAATKMRDALVLAGVARADLQTSNVNIGTKMNDDRVIIGYTVGEGLTAKIRNLPRAGMIMSAGLGAGGDAARLNGVSFAVENDDELLTEARKKAFADARAKAELYAREAGRPLGRVVKVLEGAPSYGGPISYPGMGAMDARLPIEPGRQQLSVTVSVEWALGAPAPVK